MWHEYLADRSNLKSPITFSPVEALMADFQENRLGIVLNPTQAEDAQKVKIYEKMNTYWENKSEVDKVNNECMHECAITGTSFRHITWQRVEREVTLIEGSRKVTEEIHQVMKFGTKKEKDKLAKRLNEDRKPITNKTTVIEYDDVVHIPVSDYEMFVDADARYLRAPAYEATDISWRQLPSVEQFRREFSNSSDPFIIRDNIDKVVPAADAEGMYFDGKPFFEAPADVLSQNQIELWRYFNKATDKYIVIANDVIIRDGPLPFNHKQLPFAVHRFIKWPQQFYGVGIAAVLESLQSEDETLRNMMLEQLKLEINPPLFINQDMYEDVDSGWDRIEPGLKVSVSGDPNQGISWLRSSGYKPEYVEMRKSIESDALKTSGINPLMYSMPKPYEAVRTNIMAMESSLKMIKKGIRNYAEGYRDARLQGLRIMQQYYPLSYVEELNEQTGEKKMKGRTIPLKGTLVTDERDEFGRLININEKKLENPNEITNLELKPDYLDLTGDIDVMIDVDTVAPTSKAMKMQNAERFLQQLVPILSNPQLRNDAAIQGLLRYYYDLYGVPKEVSDMLTEAPSKDGIMRADIQNTQLLAGQLVPPFSGENQDHIKQHQQFLVDLVMQRENMSRDPNAGVQQLNTLNRTIALVAKHMEGDAIPKELGSQYANKQAAPAPQQPPQGGQMPPQMPGQMPQGGQGMGGQPSEISPFRSPGIMPGMGGVPGMPFMNQ
jgi:hypothetical protein